MARALSPAAAITAVSTASACGTVVTEDGAQDTGSGTSDGAITVVDDAGRTVELDEPTSALDLRYQIETLQIVRSVTREEGVTALIAIHDLNHAAHFCDQAVLLDGGRVVADGPPAEAFDAAVLSRVYGLDVRVTRGELGVEVRPSALEAA